VERLRLDYYAARAESIDAGKVPAEPSDRELDAMSRAVARVRLMGSVKGGGSVGLAIRAGNWATLARESIAPDEWPSVLLIAGAATSRARQAYEATEGKWTPELYELDRSCQKEWGELVMFAARGAGCEGEPECAVASGAIGWLWATFTPLESPPKRDPLGELRAETAAAR
jgi:hypothetical protein